MQSSRYRISRLKLGIWIIGVCTVVALCRVGPEEVINVYTVGITTLAAMAGAAAMIEKR